MNGCTGTRPPVCEILQAGGFFKCMTSRCSRVYRGRISYHDLNALGNLQGVHNRGRAQVAERRARPQMRTTAWPFFPDSNLRRGSGRRSHWLGHGFRGYQSGVRAARRPARPQLPKRHRRPREPDERDPGAVDLDASRTNPAGPLKGMCVRNLHIRLRI